MADYANRADKEIIVVLAGCIGYADTLKDLEFRNSKKGAAQFGGDAKPRIKGTGSCGGRA